jgi:hypothetical protein
MEGLNEIFYLLTALLRSDFEECPLKVLVGANSPSLWPTIFSVMNNGTMRRPSCTAMVRPSMSGIITDALDHVRMTALLLLRRASSTFLISLG